MEGGEVMMGDDPLFTTVFSLFTKAGSGAEISAFNHFSLTYSRFRDQEAQWEQTVDVLRGNMET